MGSALLRGLNGGPSVRLLDTNAATALLRQNMANSKYICGEHIQLYNYSTMTEYPGLADLLMKNCTTQRCSMMVRHLVLVKRDRARIGIAHEGGWCQSLCQAIQALDAWSVAGFANGVANLSHHSI